VENVVCPRFPGVLRLRQHALEAFDRGRPWHHAHDVVGLDDEFHPVPGGQIELVSNGLGQGDLAFAGDGRLHRFLTHSYIAYYRLSVRIWDCCGQAIREEHRRAEPWTGSANG